MFSSRASSGGTYVSSGESACKGQIRSKIAAKVCGILLAKYEFMEIFLDSGSLEEIGHAVDLGVVDGVTINPTLSSKEDRPFRQLVLEMCEILKDGVVNAEVVSTDTQGMLREARELAIWQMFRHPLTERGLEAFLKDWEKAGQNPVRLSSLNNRSIGI